ncbi:unnamed protein product, partial [Mesorhabditis spiculigera]
MAKKEHMPADPSPYSKSAYFPLYFEKDIIEPRQPLPGGGQAEPFICGLKGLQGKFVVKFRKNTVKEANGGLADNRKIRTEYGNHFSASTHPNILRVFGKIELEKDGSLGAVFEYHPEGSLAELIRGNIYTYDEENIVDWLADIASALSHIHSRARFYHGDVSDGNVLLRNGRTVAVLSDFGLARTNSSEGHVSGTPGYMAPEAYRGETTLKSDVYSLGALLWRLSYRESLVGTYNQQTLSDKVKKDGFHRDYSDMAANLKPILKNCCAHQVDARWDASVAYEELVKLQGARTSEERKQPTFANQGLGQPGVVRHAPRDISDSGDGGGGGDLMPTITRDQPVPPPRAQQYSRSLYQPNPTSAWSSSQSRPSGSSSAERQNTSSQTPETSGTTPDPTVSSEGIQDKSIKDRAIPPVIFSEREEQERRYWLKLFDIYGPMPGGEPLISVTRQGQATIAAIGWPTERGTTSGSSRQACICVKTLYHLATNEENHDFKETRVYTEQVNEHEILTALKWNQEGTMLAAILQGENTQRLITARVIEKDHGFQVSHQERKIAARPQVCSYASVAMIRNLERTRSVAPIIDWAPGMEGQLAVCFADQLLVLKEERYQPHTDNIHLPAFTLRHGMSVDFEPSTAPAQICGWDATGDKFSYYFSGHLYTWSASEARLRTRPLTLPRQAKHHLVIGEYPKRTVHVVCEMPECYEIWAFANGDFTLVEVVTKASNQRMLGVLPSESKSDIRYVQPFESRLNSFPGGVCIASNQPTGTNSSVLVVHLAGSESKQLALNGGDSQIRAMRFKPNQPHLAALTEKKLIIYETGPELKAGCS